MSVQERPDPSIDHTRALAQRAARVQDMLGDLEVSLLPGGDSPALRLVRDLKIAWRAFRDEAMPDGATSVGSP